jgi:4-diphosphocytidyl-2-C-methyl-D-erythritol kinase
MVPLRLKSPAKLNLILNLIRKREDGFHEVDFVMQELEIHDTIKLEMIPNSSEIKLECDDATVPLDSKNTCYKAARLMQEECQKQKKPVQGALIGIQKKIPAAGGFGGGSSNAAAVIKGLNELWNLELSKNVLSTVAAGVGSDVPFFIYGGTCRAQGRGEMVTPIEKCPSLYLAFIVPLVKVPADKTRWIYSHFNVKEVNDHPSVPEMIRAIQTQNSKLVAEKMGNVFENNLSFTNYDPVLFLMDSLKTFPGVWNVILAGAGPTVCVVCESQKLAEQIVSPFKAKGQTAFVTQTV